MDNLKKYRRVQDLIEKKEYTKAKEELRKIIREHPKMKEYKKGLQDIGFLFEAIEIDEKVYSDIREILKTFPVPVQKQILDTVFKQIAA